MFKSCSRCGLSKSIQEFYPKRKSLNSRCKLCCAGIRLDYYAKYPDKKKLSNMVGQLAKYGIKPADYDRMYSSQNGQCAGCLRHQSEFKRRLYVDHNHATGQVRGLLCHGCNIALGAAKDNPQTLQRLAQYLKPELADHNSNVVELDFTKKVG